MIGILLKILAVIGWILLAVIALIVLIMLIVLLVPLRYRVEAHAGNDADRIRINGRLSWLLHLIGVRFSYENREADHLVRVAWKKLGQEEEDSERAQKKAARKAKKEARKEKNAARKAEKSGGGEASSVDQQEHTEPAETTEQKAGIEPAAKQEPIVHLSMPKQEFSDDIEKLAGDDAEDKRREKEEKKRARKEKRAERREKRKKGERTFRLPDFSRIEEKVHFIGDRKEDILSFLENKSHHKALKHLLRRLKKTGKKLIPRDWEIGGTVGMEDPFATVRLTAITDMLFPFIGEHVPIDFDFEDKVLDLDGHAAGKLRLGTFVAMILPLLIDRHFWRTIKDVLRLKKRFTATPFQDKGGKAA